MRSFRAIAFAAGLLLFGGGGAWAEATTVSFEACATQWTYVMDSRLSGALKQEFTDRAGARGSLVIDVSPGHATTGLSVVALEGGQKFTLVLPGSERELLLNVIAPHRPIHISFAFTKTEVGLKLYDFSIRDVGGPPC